MDTREKIIQTALRLFAQDGYEAVSVADIAAELGLTKGALYRHFRNKRAVFDSIVERMFELDRQQSGEHGVPQETYSDAPGTYGQTSLDQLRSFALAQLSFWTENEFAVHFRRMLALEQYRSPEMNRLYQQTIVSGPVDYLTDLFVEMIRGGTLREGDARAMALAYYAPLFLLIALHDGQAHTDAPALLDREIQRFMDDYARR